MEKTVLTGIKPTGIPHIGNLMGAIRPAVELSKTAERSLIFIADLHALNSTMSAEEVAKNTDSIAVALLTAGLDPGRTIMFRQSDIPEVSQLAMMLMNVTAKGHMNRAHSYKAAVAANVEADREADVGINMGLYTYPILMAADILLYDTTHVPVGADQKQHVEFAKDIAAALNNRCGDVLTIPEPVISAQGDMLVGTDGRKMSKSYNNTISLYADDEEIDQLIKRFKTDSRGVGESKAPETVDLFKMFKHFATPAQTRALAEMLYQGVGYGEVKQHLAAQLKRVVRPYRAAQMQHELRPEDVNATLASGAAKARDIAQQTLKRVSLAMLGR
jgi:tryptophanyl-tRNA synthetase